MCVVRIITISGVIMQNSTVRTARTRLAVLGMALGISMFSITVATVPTNHSVSHVQLAGSDDDLGTSTTTTNGVFGWD